MLRRLNIAKNFHVLMIHDKDKGVFLAHCLDMDIVEEGKTDKEALSNLKELIQTQLEYCVKEDIVDTILRPAPKEYWDSYYRSQATNIINELLLHRRNTINTLTHHFEVAYA